MHFNVKHKLKNTFAKSILFMIYEITDLKGNATMLSNGNNFKSKNEKGIKKFLFARVNNHKKEKKPKETK